MPTHPFEPPQEVGGGNRAGIASILWLVVGMAAATVLLWPCLMMTFLALLPWQLIGPEEDHGLAVRAEILGRLFVSAASSLPLALIESMLIMLVGNRRR
jgi:hypothetical protein